MYYRSITINVIDFFVVRWYNFIKNKGDDVNDEWNEWDDYLPYQKVERKEKIKNEK